MKLEIERKWIVKNLDITSLFEMFDNLDSIQRIEQDYLVQDKDKISPRIRKVVEGINNKKTYYNYNKKHPVESGVNKETEYEISEKEFHKLKKTSDPSKNTVHKTRLSFKYDKQLFELDIFHGNLTGLIILELEMSDINDKVKLPEFLDIVKEVTDDKKYSNFNLANY